MKQEHTRWMKDSAGNASFDFSELCCHFTGKIMIDAVILAGDGEG